MNRLSRNGPETPGVARSCATRELSVPLRTSADVVGCRERATYRCDNGAMSDPRPIRTRAALVNAASALLAEGRVTASIQEITDLAGVGFGSFHNHFGSKDALWEAAVQETMLAHSAMLAVASADITDPAERFAVGLRTTCAMQRSLPQMVKVVLNAGTRILNLPDGIGPQARADIADGVEHGRFVVRDPELAFMAIGGALLGALQHLVDRPEVSAEEVASNLAESLLRQLGVSAEEAARLATAPLP